MAYLFNHEGKAYSPDGDAPITESRAATDERNARLEQAELNAWKACPPRAFVYIDEKNSAATTWLGSKLGNVTLGPTYRTPAFGCFPSKRRSVTLRAINGRTYHGTYFVSSGNYARVKLSKAV